MYRTGRNESRMIRPQDTPGTPGFIFHHSSVAWSMRVLVVGEGDFSLSHSLFVHVQRGSISQLVSTTFTRVQEHERVFPRSDTIINELTARGALIIYGVDAGTLHQEMCGDAGQFDLVWFSFPFADPPSLPIDAQHAELVDKFLRSARRVLRGY